LLQLVAQYLPIGVESMASKFAAASIPSHEFLLACCPHPDYFVPETINRMRCACDAFKMDNSNIKIITGITQAFKGVFTMLDHAAPQEGSCLHEVGDRVILQGLKQRLDLNGCRAVVRSYADDHDGRFAVDVGTGKSKEYLRLKSCNMLPEWHAAAHAHAACVGRLVVLRVRNIAISQHVCRVVSYDPETNIVGVTVAEAGGLGLSVAGEQLGAKGDAVVHQLPVADVAPAAYCDIARAVYECALKVILMPGSHVAASAMTNVINAVSSGVSFFIRCARDEEAASICVSMMQTLHSATRSGVALRSIYFEDYKNRAKSFMDVCQNSTREEFTEAGYFDAAITVLVQCKEIVEEFSGDNSPAYAFLLQHIATLYAPRAFLHCIFVTFCACTRSWTVSMRQRSG
jgi:hypothetical protein